MLDPDRTDAPGRKVLTKNVESIKQVVVLHERNHRSNNPK